MASVLMTKRQMAEVVAAWYNEDSGKYIFEITDFLEDNYDWNEKQLVELTGDIERIDD